MNWASDAGSPINISQKWLYIQPIHADNPKLSTSIVETDGKVGGIFPWGGNALVMVFSSECYYFVLCHPIYYIEEFANHTELFYWLAYKPKKQTNTPLTFQ